MSFKKVLFLSLLILCIVSLATTADTAKRFKLNFKDAYLIYVPESGTLQIITANSVLSYGKDWKVKKMKSYLFALKQKNWKGFFWKVNTSRKEVYVIKGVDFGEMGGDSKTLKDITVEPLGDAAKPKNFQLKFENAYMAYLPDKKMQQVAASGYVLSYCTDWQVKQLKSYLYHFKLNTWKGFFWHVNSSRKQVHKVTEIDFGKMGGKLKLLDIEVELY